MLKNESAVADKSRAWHASSRCRLPLRPTRLCKFILVLGCKRFWFWFCCFGNSLTEESCGMEIDGSFLFEYQHRGFVSVACRTVCAFDAGLVNKDNFEVL